MKNLLLLIGILFFSNSVFSAEIICTISCKDEDGNSVKIETSVFAKNKQDAKTSLIGFIDISHSKAAYICQQKGLILDLSKKDETVNCK